MKSNPNIILIVLDTIRKDTLFENLWRLPCLNYLLEHSVNYNNTVSPSSWTIPSHASMLSGRYPIEHGMHVKYNLNEFFDSITAFPKNFIPLPEKLRNLGYNTTSIVANAVLGRETAFSRGFDAIAEVGPFVVMEYFKKEINSHIGNRNLGGVGGITGEESKLEIIKRIGLRNAFKILNLQRQQKTKLNSIGYPMHKGAREVKQAFEQLKLKSPFFVFINLMEGHEPYRVNSDFTDIMRFYLRNTLNGNWSKKNNYQLFLREIKEKLFLEISIIDDFLAQIFMFLKSNSLYESTEIIITSDHGQSLGEDDFVGHGYMLNDSLVNVPLIIKTTRNSRYQVDDFTSTVDIYNYILALTEDCNVTYPLRDYFFSEAYGQNKLTWEYLVGRLSETNLPEVRKRVWNKSGYSIIVNGSTGSIESFQKRGIRIDDYENRQTIEELLLELELFTGEQNFNFPRRLTH